MMDQGRNVPSITYGYSSKQQNRQFRRFQLFLIVSTKDVNRSLSDVTKAKALIEEQCYSFVISNREPSSLLRTFLNFPKAGHGSRARGQSFLCPLSLAHASTRTIVFLSPTIFVPAFDFFFFFFFSSFFCFYSFSFQTQRNVSVQFINDTRLFFYSAEFTSPRYWNDRSLSVAPPFDTNTNPRHSPLKTKTIIH